MPDPVQEGFRSRKALASKERRFAIAGGGWKSGKRVHGIGSHFRMSFSFFSHPKALAKRLSLGCRPFWSFANKVATPRSVGILPVGLAMFAFLCSPLHAGFSTKEQNGRIEIRDGGKVVLAWQKTRVSKPGVGKKFAGSAFLNPVCTPGGFVLTDLQPPDHRHHFGVWWPWKYLDVDGKKYNCWEVQEGEGRLTAAEAKVEKEDADEVVLSLKNRFEVFEGGRFVPVVRERAKVRLFRLGEDAYGIDVSIDEEPEPGRKVVVHAYRYSGFSWRGTPEWNAKNSRMLTSRGDDRDTANRRPARWVAFTGETPGGQATMLMMSAAAKNGGKPELLRVWTRKMGGDGKPSVNFNPVVRQSIPLDAAHPEVSRRQYRLIVADRKIPAKEAGKLWKDWKPVRQAWLGRERLFLVVAGCLRVSRLRVVGREPGGDGVGVFAEDRGARFPGDGAGARVVAGLDAGDGFGVVHHVGFVEEDRAEVEAVGQEIAGPEVGVAANVAGALRVGLVAERRQPGAPGEDGRRFGAERGLFVVDALEQAQEEFEALVGAGDFRVGERAADEDVEMVSGRERRMLRVAPGFGVEVEAEDEVRADFLVDFPGAGSDFGGAVEEFFGEFPGFFGRGAGRFRDESGFGQRFRAPAGEWFGGVAHQGDPGAEGFEAWFEESGDLQGEVAFGDRLSGGRLEPALLHARPATAEVAGVDGDAQAGERSARRGGAEFPGRTPPAFRGAGSRGVRGEAQRVAVVSGFFSGE